MGRTKLSSRRNQARAASSSHTSVTPPLEEPAPTPPPPVPQGYQYVSHHDGIPGAIRVSRMGTISTCRTYNWMYSNFERPEIEAILDAALGLIHENIDVHVDHVFGPNHELHILTEDALYSLQSWLGDPAALFGEETQGENVKDREDILKKFIEDIVQGADFLHSHDMLHRIVHPSTIVIHQESKNWAIGNFEFSKYVPDTGRAFTNIDLKDQMFTAPEVIAGQGHSRSSDMYGIGIVICCFIIKLYGRPEASLQSASGENWEESLRVGECPEWMIEIVQQLTAQNPEARLTARQVLAKVNTRPGLELLYSGITASMELLRDGAVKQPSAVPIESRFASITAVEAHLRAEFDRMVPAIEAAFA